MSECPNLKYSTAISKAVAVPITSLALVEARKFRHIPTGVVFTCMYYPEYDPLPSEFKAGKEIWTYRNMIVMTDKLFTKHGFFDVPISFARYANEQS